MVGVNQGGNEEGDGRIEVSGTKRFWEQKCSSFYSTFCAIKIWFYRLLCLGANMYCIVLRRNREKIVCTTIRENVVGTKVLQIPSPSSKYIDMLECNIRKNLHVS